MDTEQLISTRRPRESLPDRGRGAVAALVVGLSLAAWGVIADVVGYVENPLIQVVLVAGNASGPWVAGAFVIGAVAARSGAGPAMAAIWAATGLVVADVSYYLGQVAVGNRSTADSVERALLTWGLIAAGAGVVLGAAGALWARPDRHGDTVAAVALGVVSGLLVAEAVYVVPYELDLANLDRLGYALVGVIVAVALVRLVPIGARRWFVQTLVVVGVVGSLVAATVMQMINAAIR